MGPRAVSGRLEESRGHGVADRVSGYPRRAVSLFPLSPSYAAYAVPRSGTGGQRPVSAAAPRGARDRKPPAARKIRAGRHVHLGIAQSVGPRPQARRPTGPGVDCRLDPRDPGSSALPHAQALVCDVAAGAVRILHPRTHSLAARIRSGRPRGHSPHAEFNVVCRRARGHQLARR